MGEGVRTIFFFFDLFSLIQSFCLSYFDMLCLPSFLCKYFRDGPWLSFCCIYWRIYFLPFLCYRVKINGHTFSGVRFRLAHSCDFYVQIMCFLKNLSVLYFTQGSVSKSHENCTLAGAHL